MKFLLLFLAWIFFQQGGIAKVMHNVKLKKKSLKGTNNHMNCIWNAFYSLVKTDCKRSCNMESSAVATYCLAKYWCRTKRLIRITLKLPQGLPSQEILLWQRLLRNFPVTRLLFSSAYFMWVQEKKFYIQKSHHSDQLIKRQYPWTTDNINVP